VLSLYARDKAGAESNLLTTGAGHERENRRCTIIGLAVRLRADTAAEHLRRTAAGSGRGARSCPDRSSAASKPPGQYQGSEVCQTARIAGRRSRRGVAVLYRLSGIEPSRQND
jgi:hypothetical protein